MPIYKVVPNDPDEPVVVKKISDIPTWNNSLSQLGQLDRSLDEQSKRDTRDSVKEKIRPADRFIHYYDFGPKLQKKMENIKAQLQSSCPNDEPTFTSHPEWFSYIKLYTEEEKMQLEYAARQREYKRIMILELEQLYIPNPYSLISIAEENNELRRSNLWLIDMINQLPDIQVIANGEESPYLDTLEIIAIKRK